MELKEGSSDVKKKYQISDELYRKIIDHYITEEGWPTEHEAIDYYHDLPAMLDISCEEFKAKTICSVKQFKRAVQKYWQDQRELGNDLPWEARYKNPDRIVNRKILSKIIEKGGPENQMKVAKEESRKLIAAIDGFFHDGDTVPLIRQVATVKIIIAQMEIIFGYDVIQTQTVRVANSLKEQLGI